MCEKDVTYLVVKIPKLHFLLHNYVCILCVYCVYIQGVVKDMCLFLCTPPSPSSLSRSVSSVACSQ